MKKYLMTALSAVALSGLFAGCSKEMETNGETTAEADIIQTYENAFITRFGQPHENQTWGFGSVAGTRSGNTSGEYAAYPATHTYTDANGNVIAGANMNHNEWGNPNTNFGGWIVPDPLTAGQKLRVQKYFQANPNLSYEDPHYANFFIQQVYTGGTDAPETGNKEATKAANGKVHAGSTLNQLTVGQACSHINDFNAGTCTTSNVLNHEGKTQSDQITLMVNVDDTSCFGYHETGGSNVKGVINHNDKMALVSAATIDAWAAANGNPGEAVVDKWNRSFMGFDYELLPEADIIPDNPIYAKFTDVPNNNNIHYAWDGTNVLEIGSAPEATQAEEVDITSTFAKNTIGNSVTCNYESDGNIVCVFAGQYYNSIQFLPKADWSPYDKLVIEFAEPSPIAATINANNGEVQINLGDTKVEVPTPDYSYVYSGGPTISCQRNGETNSLTLKIKSVKLVKEASAPDASVKYYDPNGYLLGDDNKVMFYSSENTNMYGGIIIDLSEDEMKTTQDGKTCLNLVKFKELADAGYHPISTDLKKWVKWQAACDGYYSDWIVTLTEAKRQTPPENPPYNPPTGFVCRIIAEDLTVGENSDFDFNDVVFDVFSDGKILVRACGGTLPLTVAGQEVHGLFGESTSTMINTGWTGTIDYVNTYREINYGSSIPDVATAYTIPVFVTKKVAGVEKQIPLTAVRAKVASKIAVGSDYKWCAEREDIDSKYHKADGTKLFQQYVIGNLGDDWNAGTAWYQQK